MPRASSIHGARLVGNAPLPSSHATERGERGARMDSPPRRFRRAAWRCVCAHPMLCPGYTPAPHTHGEVRKGCTLPLFPYRRLPGKERKRAKIAGYCRALPHATGWRPPAPRYTPHRDTRTARMPIHPPAPFPLAPWHVARSSPLSSHPARTLSHTRVRPARHAPLTHAPPRLDAPSPV